jgi:N-acetylneuraminic acid mutarotase
MKAALILLSILTVACGDDGASGSADASAIDAARGGDAGEGAGWETLASLPTAIQETAVVELDGLIYVIGGIDGAGATLNQVNVYDVAGNSWSTVAALPTPVHHANAAVVGGKIYVVGSLFGNFGSNGAVWEFDPTLNSWAELGTMPAGTERGASAVGVIDDVIYIAGGMRQLGSVDDFSSFTPADQSWDTTLPPTPQPLNHLAGQSVDGVFYLVGGREVGIDGVVGRVDAYDPGVKSWSGRAAMPTGRGGMASGVVNGSIVVVGGEGNPAEGSGVYPQVESYDPTTDSWTQLAPMKTPRHGMGAVGYQGALYVPGGATVQGFGATEINEVLRF